MEPPEVRYAKSGEVSIAYAVVGDGPFDVVFVSGWILSNLGVAWEGSAAEFYEGMAKFCRLILFDKRGTGMSDRAAGVPDLQTRMDDIRAVMDAVGSNRAAIMGFSEGGPMSMLFAATHPERTAALVLYGTLATFHRADDYPWALPYEELKLMLTKNEDRRGTVPWMDEALQGLAPTTFQDEGIKRWWRRWIQTSASPGATRDLSVMNSEIDVRHTLPAIGVPTLVLHRVGDEDVVPDEGRYLADRIPGADFTALDGVDHGWWVNSGQLVEEIEPFLRGIWERGEWNVEAEPDRILATVMFTDIVGSTQMLAEVGDRGWRDLLQRHHALIRRQLTRYAGREVDTAGDGFFASFDGPARAIRCACSIRDSISDLGIKVRAGLHTGECEVIDGKVAGIAVHIGARVASQAESDEVLVSSTVKDLVAGSGIQFAEKGRAELKGIPGEWSLYAVTAV
ncbi:MAG TPA: adenylate/guanylate cyclase domain-containing protein [Actinomycetota bacterium]